MTHSAFPTLFLGKVWTPSKSQITCGSGNCSVTHTSTTSRRSWLMGVEKLVTKIDTFSTSQRPSPECTKSFFRSTTARASTPSLTRFLRCAGSTTSLTTSTLFHSAQTEIRITHLLRLLRCLFVAPTCSLILNGLDVTSTPTDSTALVTGTWIVKIRL